MIKESSTNKQQSKLNKEKMSYILVEEEFHKALLSLASVKDVSSSAVSLYIQNHHLEVYLAFDQANKVSKKCN